MQATETLLVVTQLIIGFIICRSYELTDYHRKLVCQQTDPKYRAFARKGNLCSIYCNPRCQNGGICNYHTRKCECEPGWKGGSCTIRGCNPTCRNGATCNAAMKCDCAPGWTGDSCDIRACTPKCQNGGTCNAAWRCECAPGWKGHSCAIREPPPPTPLVTDPPGPRHCKCGIPAWTFMVIGGMDVKIGETPWHVGLSRQPNQAFFCGGSVINDQWVLTAAHCFVNFWVIPCRQQVYNELYVGVGFYDRFKITSDKSVMLAVKQQIIHPKFNCRTIDNDFALLQLEKPIDLGRASEVQPVCLPGDGSRDYRYLDAMILGWGLTKENGKQSEKLQKGDVRIWNTSCSIKEAHITPNMMCAKGSVKVIDGELLEVDTCKGDSGGSLTIWEHGIYTQVGVTSFGIGCARIGNPGVYARVTTALQWITDVAGYYCVRK